MSEVDLSKSPVGVFWGEDNEIAIDRSKWGVGRREWDSGEEQTNPPSGSHHH